MGVLLHRSAGIVRRHGDKQEREVVTPPRDPIMELLEELAEAKSWPEQLKERLALGRDISSEVHGAEAEVAALERRARAALRELGRTVGCANPTTRLLFRSMADMLIYWYAFKDSLPVESSG
jgi:predicted RNase H-like nuclease (RuvC/YqgF family)